MKINRADKDYSIHLDAGLQFGWEFESLKTGPMWTNRLNPGRDSLDFKIKLTLEKDNGPALGSAEIQYSSNEIYITIGQDTYNQVDETGKMEGIKCNDGSNMDIYRKIFTPQTPQ